MEQHLPALVHREVGTLKELGCLGWAECTHRISSFHPDADMNVFGRQPFNVYLYLWWMARLRARLWGGKCADKRSLPEAAAHGSAI